MLTSEQADDIRRVLVELYGPSFADTSPTDQTVEILETMLEEMHKCNRRIQILFKSLHCAIVGSGWLKRCLKAVVNIILREPHEFVGCHNTALWLYKTPLHASGMR